MSPRRSNTPRPPCWALLAGVALLVLGCREAGGDEDAVAYVGAEPVTYDEFTDFVEEMTGGGDEELASDVLSALFDQFLVEEQLLRLALERRLVEAGASRRDALAALLEAAATRAEISHQEVEAYYRSHPEQFERPERVRLRQILVEERTVAEQALAELTAGAPFAEVAGRLSIDPSAPLGGDQGELAAGDLPEAFAAAIFELEPGEVSEILEATYGLHIFQVTARLPAEVVPLEAAAGQIREQLELRELDRKREALVHEAAERHEVRIEPARLPFSYRAGGVALE